MNRETIRQIKAIIIGGGASGIVLAINLSKKFGGQNVLLVEKLSRLSKKLLVTGNGQCNFTNKDVSKRYYHSQNSCEISNILEKYSNKNFIDFMLENGVVSTLDGDKYYPLSKQASSVVDALRFKLQSLNVNVMLDSCVTDIKKENSNFLVTLNSGEILKSQCVIVATGGKSASHLGTDGASYKLLTNFGHTLTKLYPSIVQLKTDKSKIKGLKGLKQKALLKGFVNDKEVCSFLGDLLFTDYGVSGNTVFSASSYLTGKTNVKIVIDFCPQLTSETLKTVLRNKIKSCPYLSIEYLLSGIMNNKIASFILKNGLGLDLTKSTLKVDVDAVASIVKNYEIKVEGTSGFENSQVTRGGILFSEFDSGTLESKIVKGLYACGEVLDVDGDCGGYNLQWAYSSACAVSEAIK